MTKVIEGETGQRVYLEVLRHLLKRGKLRAPRGEPTLDLGFTTIELSSPRNALPLGVGRDLNPNIAAAEAIQLIGGFARPDLLTRASSNFERYLDDGKFHGAYGARVGYQALNVVRKLQADAQTRQAVITLWDPWLDNLDDKRDYPCTVMIQFEARNPGLNAQQRWALDMNVIMRSNDAWLGLPYDMFQFAQLQYTVARVLGWKVGTYRHTTLSLHIYVKDVAAAEKIELGGPPAVESLSTQATGIGRPGDSYTAIMKRARRLASEFSVEWPTTSEDWYAERFASYMGRDVVADGESDRAAEPVQS